MQIFLDKSCRSIIFLNCTCKKKGESQNIQGFFCNFYLLGSICAYFRSICNNVEAQVGLRLSSYLFPGLQVRLACGIWRRSSRLRVHNHALWSRCRHQRRKVRKIQTTALACMGLFDCFGRLAPYTQGGQQPLKVYRLPSLYWARPRDFDDNGVLPSACASSRLLERKCTSILHVCALLQPGISDPFLIRSRCSHEYLDLGSYCGRNDTAE